MLTKLYYANNHSSYINKTVEIVFVLNILVIATFNVYALLFSFTLSLINLFTIQIENICFVDENKIADYEKLI